MLNTIYRFVMILFVITISCSGHTMDLSWNGFGSAYYAQAYTNGLFAAEFSDTNVDFTSFSSMGLNLGASIDKNLNFTAQLVALGSSVGTTDSFGLLAQWAYVNYTPTDETSIKAGRQLLPLFMASEYVRVGYLMPYQQIPTLLFSTAPFSRFDGVSVNHTFATSIGDLTLGLFGGSPLLDTNLAKSNSPFETTTVNIENLIGGQVVLDGDGWRVRATAAAVFSSETTTLTASPNNPIFQEAHNQLYSVGYRYDKRLLSWGECLMVQSPDGTPVAATGGRFGGYDSGCYVLLGYHIGKFTPRYTYAQTNENINAGSASFPGQYANGTAKSHNLGLNYQAGQKVVVKAEYQRIVLTSDTDDISAVLRQTGSTATYADAAWVGIDYVF
jgi:hypothetical protein